MRAGIARAHSRGQLAHTRGQEVGAGTVLALALGLVVMICMGAALLLAQAAIVAHRAASAADLAALAGADAARGLTAGDPCTTAGETAVRHGASLANCAVSGGEIVDVTTRVDRGMVGTATGRARAGPPP
ncbi:Rv3654c family TadE-like protein [Arthrobacter sp. NyZ413]|uniref:Rv3654c family TadE-like protein n=1 Tax=Arthrobacter sp. NyZ413 TaxID=3144669 RepID=UPI002B919049|nr:Rv3654c family TadE-like protein [Arthrobacter sp.]